MVCLLIGCTREQLEDSEFKNKELGEEWSKWICNFDLVKNFGLFPTKIAAESYTSSQGNKGKLINIYAKTLTPRELLQKLGTECGRQIIHPNIWINALFVDYKLDNGIVIEPISEENKGKYPIGQAPIFQQYYRESQFPNWIITDVRFKNEAKAIKDRGGIVIRINRDSLNIKENSHQSEIDLDDYEFDYTIYNNSDISSLINSVRDMLIYFKIL